jgi:hypothetical protein
MIRSRNRPAAKQESLLRKVLKRVNDKHSIELAESEIFKFIETNEPVANLEKPIDSDSENIVVGNGDFGSVDPASTEQRRRYQEPSKQQVTWSSDSFESVASLFSGNMASMDDLQELTPFDSFSLNHFAPVETIKDRTGDGRESRNSSKAMPSNLVNHKRKCSELEDFTETRKKHNSFKGVVIAIPSPVLKRKCLEEPGVESKRQCCRSIRLVIKPTSSHNGSQVKLSMNSMNPSRHDPGPKLTIKLWKLREISLMSQGKIAVCQSASQFPTSKIASGDLQNRD